VLPNVSRTSIGWAESPGLAEVNCSAKSRDRWELSAAIEHKYWCWN